MESCFQGQKACLWVLAPHPTHPTQFSHCSDTPVGWPQKENLVYSGQSLQAFYPPQNLCERPEDPNSLFQAGFHGLHLHLCSVSALIWHACCTSDRGQWCRRLPRFAPGSKLAVSFHLQIINAALHRALWLQGSANSHFFQVGPKICPELRDCSLFTIQNKVTPGGLGGGMNRCHRFSF